MNRGCDFTKSLLRWRPLLFCTGWLFLRKEQTIFTQVLFGNAKTTAVSYLMVCNVTPMQTSFQHTAASNQRLSSHIFMLWFLQFFCQQRIYVFLPGLILQINVELVNLSVISPGALNYLCQTWSIFFGSQHLTQHSPVLRTRQCVFLIMKRNWIVCVPWTLLVATVARQLDFPPRRRSSHEVSSSLSPLPPFICRPHPSLVNRASASPVVLAFVAEPRGWITSTVLSVALKPVNSLWVVAAPWPIAKIAHSWDGAGAPGPVLLDLAAGTYWQSLVHWKGFGVKLCCASHAHTSDCRQTCW